MKKFLKGRKAFLLTGIVLNIITLLYFKYSNFLISSVNYIFKEDYALRNTLLPLGISFYTFQQIAYLVDAYRHEADNDSFIEYLLYVLYFPKLLMGPITLREALIPQFRDASRKKISYENFERGIILFTFGLCKKVLFADTFVNAVTFIFNYKDSCNSIDIFLGMICYSFQIYFDFSGYSDMAIGTSLMLNIELLENFNSPYKALSIRDFWKRWHISLTKFLTKYIYFPLGGNRKGKIRTYFNVMIVFLISGFWHGASVTFILWGILHGAFSCLDRILGSFEKKVPKAIRLILTFLIVSWLWLLFRSNSIGEWLDLTKKMLSFDNIVPSVDLLKTLVTSESETYIKLIMPENLVDLSKVLFGFFFIVCSFILCLCFKNSNEKQYKNNKATPILIALLLVFSITLLGSKTTFIYSNF